MMPMSELAQKLESSQENFIENTMITKYPESTTKLKHAGSLRIF
jgi:hypothetical protein